MARIIVMLAVAFVISTALAQVLQCPDYTSYSRQQHEPVSEGRLKLPYQRPEPACRKFNLTEVEDTITDMKKLIKDPDLFRLFENCFPNTIDTAITWKGLASETKDEELTFITTGDINAMWLRDSANQLQSYKAVLKANSSQNSLASLYRGAINLHARYVQGAPFCNAFQAPIESNLTAEINLSSNGDFVDPYFPINLVFECKYELDSLAAFLQLSYDYFAATGDKAFFGKHNWVAAVDMLLNTTADLLVGTYAEDGKVNNAPFRFRRYTMTASETLANYGEGNPVKGGTGLVRSAFRPSDDACIYQFFIPGNMMLARYLDGCAEIMVEFDERLGQRMKKFAEDISKGIEKYGRTHHPDYGIVYAYEVDGFGSHSMMDDANIPSLLSAPMLGYLDKTDEVYQNTRKFVLSHDNPYFMHGPVMNSTGGPHIGPGMAWPMSLIVQILTSDDDEEILEALRQLLTSTDGLGLMHESISTQNQRVWTRQWFAWTNGLFGQMMLDLKERKPHLLATSFQ